MIRMIDIAREAGVSRPQVSAVLSGKKTTIGVSAEKAAEIRLLAAKYHYRPNVMAQALRGKSTKTIGILQDSHASISNFHFLGALESVLSSHGYRMLAGEGHADPAIHWENYMTLRQYGVDGVFSLSHDYPGEQERLTRMFSGEKNMVFIGSPKIGDHPMACADVAWGVRSAVHYLLQSGRKRPGLVYIDTGSSVMEARRRGFLEACPDGEERILVLSIGRQPGTDAASRAVEELIGRRKCDAVVAYNDVFAFRILNQCALRKIRVPEDAAVIGQDNDELGQYTLPALTTISSPREKVAQAAFSLFQAMLKGEKPEDQMIQPELILRGSA